MMEDMESMDRKMCQTHDSRELDEMSASGSVTCGMCGARANNASFVCEAGIHSDVT